MKTCIEYGVEDCDICHLWGNLTKRPGMPECQYSWLADEFERKLKLGPDNVKDFILWTFRYPPDLDKLKIIVADQYPEYVELIDKLGLLV
jgi:hypothetical protein